MRQQASKTMMKRGLATLPKKATKGSKKAKKSPAQKGAKKLKPAPAAPIPREATHARCTSLQNTIKVLSSNVAGLRAVINTPEKKSAMKTLLDTERPAVFCIQEHKLQEKHVETLREEVTKP